MPNKVDYLQEIDIFQEFTEEDFTQLAQIAHLQNFIQQDLILTAEELTNKVYLLKRGEVTIYALDKHGKRIVLDILKPGAIFGDLSSTHESTVDQEIYAEASSDGHLCVCSRDNFFRLLETKPKVLLRILNQLARKLRLAEEKIRDLALRDAKERILNTLGRFAHEHGQHEANSLKAGRLTHERIAEMTGLTRETVTKSLNLLKQEGRIHQDKDKNLYLLTPTNH